MDWVGWVISGVGLLVGGATLAVTVPSLVLSRRAERRATERSVVEWYAGESEPGQVWVTNQGIDPAFEVTVDVWDGRDFVSRTRATALFGDEINAVLPTRRAEGPEPVDLPTRITPRVPDEPPEGVQLPTGLTPPGLRQMNDEQRARWELLKASQDSADAMEARMREKAEAEQGSVRVTWRSALGTWSTTMVDLS
jgi:hypothetical protein